MRHVRTASIALALVSIGAIAGCSQQQTTSERSARITIDGATQTTHALNCSQLQGFWTFDVGDQASGVEATVFLSGKQVTPKWVKIRDFGGFTGSFWQGGVGSANAAIDRKAFMITGTAYGIGKDRPNHPTTTNFSIVANC